MLLQVSEFKNYFSTIHSLGGKAVNMHLILIILIRTIFFSYFTHIINQVTKCNSMKSHIKYLIRNVYRKALAEGASSPSVAGVAGGVGEGGFGSLYADVLGAAVPKPALPGTLKDEVVGPPLNTSSAA